MTKVYLGDDDRPYFEDEADMIDYTSEMLSNFIHNYCFYCKVYLPEISQAKILRELKKEIGEIFNFAYPRIKPTLKGEGRNQTICGVIQNSSEPTETHE